MGNTALLRNPLAPNIRPDGVLFSSNGVRVQAVDMKTRTTDIARLPAQLQYSIMRFA